MKRAYVALAVALALGGCATNPAEPFNPADCYIEITYPTSGSTMFCTSDGLPATIEWDSDIPYDQGRVIAVYVERTYPTPTGRMLVGHYYNGGGIDWKPEYRTFGSWLVRVEYTRAPGDVYDTQGYFKEYCK